MSYNQSRGLKESGYQPRKLPPQGAPPLRNSPEGLAAQQRALVERASVEEALAEQARAQRQAQKRAQRQAYAPVAVSASVSRASAPAPVSASASRVSASREQLPAPAPASTQLQASRAQLPAPVSAPPVPTTVTTQKEKKPFYRRKPFIIFLVIILCVGIVLGLGLGLGLKSNTDTSDTSEPTYTSTSRSSTPTAPTPAPITTTPTTTAPTTTSVSLTQGPAPPPPSKPSVFLPRKLDDNGKVILYDIDVIKNVGKPENDVYNIIYENNNIKELETLVTFNSPYGNKNYIGKIKIKNCKINLKRTYFDKNGVRYDASENFYNYMNDDNWTEVPFINDSFISYYGDIKIPNYYTSAIITIMSEIILFDEKQQLIINSQINNINITQEIVIPNILISGFKIKNCTITLYSVNEVVEYSSSSKKESYLMEILPTVYNKIKIVPNRI